MMGYIEAGLAPLRNTGEIKLHGADAFEAMRVAGQVTARALDMVTDLVRPGVTTAELDRAIFEFAMDNCALPATLYYRGFTHSSCISLNEVVCHGIPDHRVLKEKDILNIDITLIVDGWHGDSSRMYAVGEIERKAERLIEVTYESLMRGCSAVKPGATTGDIGAAIQSYAEGERMGVVRDFCGHGLGKLFHDVPNILHYVPAGKPSKLLPGMLFTIEPMINLGGHKVKIKGFRKTPEGKVTDNWTAITVDRTLSAQFEHTVGVTETGIEIFTSSPKGLDCPPYKTT